MGLNNWLTFHFDAFFGCAPADTYYDPVDACAWPQADGGREICSKAPVTMFYRVSGTGVVEFMFRQATRDVIFDLGSGRIDAKYLQDVLRDPYFYMVQALTAKVTFPSLRTCELEMLPKEEDPQCSNG
ncbi:hypothetical protein [Burkholderia sp. JKS000303]|uniref:hypothetical protein n=1 Tax=Burkholderia sp. JKS000303 TaxID=1938747 RepID=UPI000BF5CD92|nr:hypothetical protein [Burkholderia sp. JKS000303]PFH29127.1 hypothetical protein BX604_2899 [Burkholderia sp. JKS000303]